VKSDAEYFFPPNFTRGDDRAASIIGDEENKRGKGEQGGANARRNVSPRARFVVDPRVWWLIFVADFRAIVRASSPERPPLDQGKTTGCKLTRRLIKRGRYKARTSTRAVMKRRC